MPARHLYRTALTIGATVLAAPAWAHSGHGDGMVAGFLHPIGGLDHVLAMVAVGLWAAFRGGKAMIAWPAAFVAAMVGGFALAPVIGPVAHLETMIASSVVLLGAVIALGFRAPLALGAGIIALAGAAHGYAHGLEVQGNALTFGLGFAIATSLLHGLGIGFGVMAQRLTQPRVLRLAGGAVAAAGLVLVLA